MHAISSRSAMLGCKSWIYYPDQLLPCCQMRLSWKECSSKMMASAVATRTDHSAGVGNPARTLAVAAIETCVHECNREIWPFWFGTFIDGSGSSRSYDGCRCSIRRNTKTRSQSSLHNSSRFKVLRQNAILSQFHINRRTPDIHSM